MKSRGRAQRKARLVLLVLALAGPYGAARPAAACPPSFPPRLEISQQLAPTDPQLTLRLEQTDSETGYRLVAVTKGALSGSALRVVLGTKVLQLKPQPAVPQASLLGDPDPSIRMSDAILTGPDGKLERDPLELRAYAGKRLVFHAIVKLIPGIMHRCVVSSPRQAPQPTPVKPASSAAPAAASSASSGFACSRGER